jgi:hypothetical protein
MGDQPGSSFRDLTSEDKSAQKRLVLTKVRRKDWCWSVRVVYVLEKLSDVSELGLVEAGRYTIQLVIVHFFGQ